MSAVQISSKFPGHPTHYVDTESGEYRSVFPQPDWDANLMQRVILEPVHRSQHPFGRILKNIVSAF